MAQDRLEEARVACERALAIHRILSEREPADLQRQTDLFTSCVATARLEARAGQDSVALTLFEEAATLFDNLVQADESANPQEAKELRKTLEAEMTVCQASEG